MFYLKLIFITIPKLAHMLSRNAVHALSVWVRMILFLISKKIRKDGRTWKFDLYFQGKPFPLKLFEGSVDIAALKEIFIDGEYTWDAVSEPQIIVDIGAHTGNTALYFHALYPSAKIYAVEASPRNYRFLKENVREIPEILPVFCAVADKDGEVVFYEAISSLGSSLRDRGNSQEVRVPSMTLESFFKKYGISRADFIKIDIEGGEESLFIHQTPEVFSSAYIVEVHDDLMHISREEFLKRFDRYTLEFLDGHNPMRVVLRALLKQ